MITQILIRVKGIGFDATKESRKIEAEAKSKSVCGLMSAVNFSMIFGTEIL